MRSSIDIMVLIIFIISMIGVSFFLKKGRIKDFKTYAVGDMEPSTLVLTATFASSIISGGFFINLLQQTYVTGLPYIVKNVLFDPLSYVITALFFIIPMHKNAKKRNLSLNEWMDEKFHSSFLRGVMGFAETVGRFGMLSIQFKVVGTIIEMMFGCSSDVSRAVTIGFAVFIIAYTSFGGFKTVVLTDILQFGVFSVALVSLIITVLIQTKCFSGMWTFGVINNPKISLAKSFSSLDATILTLGLWIKTLFPKLNGPRYQRIVMTKDPNKAKKSLIYAAIITSLFITFSVCVALQIYSKHPTLKINQIMPYFMENYCPVGLRGLVASGLIAMSISTADSVLNSSSVVFTNDVCPFFFKLFTKKEYIPTITTARITNICMGIIGLLIALKATDIFSLLMGFGNFYNPIATVPSIILILGYNVRKESIISGIILGVLATVIYYAYTGNIASFFVGIVANLSGLLLSQLYFYFTKKDVKPQNV